MTLRKPKNFKGTHYGVVNSGSKNSPAWYKVKQVYPKQKIEIIRKPNLEVLPDLMNLTNNNSFIHNLENSKISIRDLEEIEKLKVKLSFLNYIR